nr:SMP-30/gluconolactonase/LRE family protein [Streptomyces melanosporofaciens]
MTVAIPTAGTYGAFRLAEGPLWDTVRQRLLWVDILAGQVLEGSLDPVGRITVTRRHRFDSMVGAVTVAEDGTLLVAAQEHLIVVEADGTRHDGPRIALAGERRRLNDGSMDPSGRFLVGILSLDGDSRRETLVRLEHNGGITMLDPRPDPVQRPRLVRRRAHPVQGRHAPTHRLRTRLHPRRRGTLRAPAPDRRLPRRHRARRGISSLGRWT